MLKFFTILVAGIFIPVAALAQSSPGLTYGQVPTAGQWNGYFASKQDVLGYTPLNQAGGTMTGPLRTLASTTSSSGFSIIPGVTPNVPNDGDVWITSSGLFYQASGTVYGPIYSGTVLGPSSSLIGDIAVFANTTGTLLSDSGKALPSSAVVGVSDTQTLTNKTVDTASGNVLKVNGTSITSTTGSGAAVLATSPTLVTPTLGAATVTSVNKLAITAPSTSATLTIANGATLTTSSSTSVGQGQYLGTATNDSASTGNLGEYITNASTGTAVTSTVGVNATSASLMAGDWDVQCVMRFQAGASTTPTVYVAGVNTISATIPTYQNYQLFSGTFATAGQETIASPHVRISIASTTTAYCVAAATFPSGSVTVDGTLRARRIR